MSQFIQLHILTSYPPANLNRDDQGRPKTAKMGGTDRLRVSSQSLKRSWRTSDLLQSLLLGGEGTFVLGEKLLTGVGVRSKKFSSKIVAPYLVKKGVSVEDADKWSKDICRAFGAMENDKNKLSQLAHISDIELQGLSVIVDDLACYLLQGNSTDFIEKFVELVKKRDSKKKSDDIKKANDSILKICSEECLSIGKTSTDIAMFGRMLASTPEFNVEAACQVSHAISVHPVVIEDDYFTAVDDLNAGNEDAGAAHIGEASFASGLFYTYICINKSLLIESLGDDKALANKAIAALTEAAVKVSPKGKQNSFASRAYASYVLAEMGEQQPRSLSAAYLKAIEHRDSEDFSTDAIERLREQYKSFDQVYGDCADSRYELNVNERLGSLKELLAFVSE